jgi:hypothetical protein
MASRDLKAMCGMRDTLVSARTKLINNVRGWLRGRGYHVRRGASASFPTRLAAIAGLAECVKAQLRAIAALSSEILAADRSTGARSVVPGRPTGRRARSAPAAGRFQTADRPCSPSASARSIHAGGYPSLRASVPTPTL